eukprot:TRINITY_DN1985_c0_g4_i1.p2 TRINITY_DN1985_c0_g4~~TRINITY_DN1985_c0_g4_i1.p2  ORF type:complete len:195 (-),score=8.96 TRINITY_DN1985_c0_g4_i1:1057-1641(-)
MAKVNLYTGISDIFSFLSQRRGNSTVRVCVCDGYGVILYTSSMFYNHRTYSKTCADIHASFKRVNFQRDLGVLLNLIEDVQEDFYFWKTRNDFGGSHNYPGKLQYMKVVLGVDPGVLEEDKTCPIPEHLPIEDDCDLSFESSKDEVAFQPDAQDWIMVDFDVTVPESDKPPALLNWVDGTPSEESADSSFGDGL